MAVVVSVLVVQVTQLRVESMRIRQALWRSWFLVVLLICDGSQAAWTRLQRAQRPARRARAADRRGKRRHLLQQTRPREQAVDHGPMAPLPCLENLPRQVPYRNSSMSRVNVRERAFVVEHRRSVERGSNPSECVFCFALQHYGYYRLFETKHIASTVNSPEEKWRQENAIQKWCVLAS